MWLEKYLAWSCALDAPLIKIAGSGTAAEGRSAGIATYDNVTLLKDR